MKTEGFYFRTVPPNRISVHEETVFDLGQSGLGVTDIKVLVLQRS